MKKPICRFVYLVDGTGGGACDKQKSGHFMAYGAASKRDTQFTTRYLRGFLLSTSAAIAVVCTAPQLAAQEIAATPQQSQAVRNFDIPSQPLASALALFNRQSGIQISQAAAGRTSNVTTRAVRGRMTPEQALAQLLDGTGVHYQFTANRAAVIGPAGDAGAPGSEEGATVLKRIVVTGKTGRNANSGAGFQGTPDWVYEEPASVSVVSRDAVQSRAARNANDVLDSVAGVTSNRSEAQNPGIAINVRGLQDQNRVTTMIDGARQDFERAGHGASQRVYVDTAFLRSVEVEKGAVAGVGGAGSLGGAVNFRTVTADDIIKPDRDRGVELNAETGTNAYYFNGSLIGAARFSEDFSVLGGISRKRVGDYDFGQNGKSPLLDLAVTTAVDDSFLFSRLETFGTLLKVEGSPSDDFTFDLSWLRNDSEAIQGGLVFGDLRDDPQNYLNNTVSSSFEWDPDSELIDLKGRLWYNRVVNDELRDYTPRLPITYAMTSFGGSLDNTSRFKTALGDLSLNYGGEAYSDNGKTTTPPLVDDQGFDEAYGYKGLNPVGRRSMTSAFLNATLEHDDWLEVGAGLRYDRYRLKGFTEVGGRKPRYIVVPGVCGYFYDDGECAYYDEDPVYGGGEAVLERVDIDKSGGALLPSARIAVMPFEGIQPFVTYAHTYRPPSVMEALTSGGHPGDAIATYIPNPYLKPERGRTWELGINIARDGLFTAGDSLRLKTVYFDRTIQDYITLGNGYFATFDKNLFQHVNLDGDTTMNGVEIEASYDMGSAYVGASYTYLKTDYADTYSYSGPTASGTPLAASGNTPVPSVLFVPPENKFTLDAGIRLFERKLVLGGRATYVSDSKPTVGQLAGLFNTAGYKVFDIYGSYSFSDSAKLRLAINNVTDEQYAPALGAFYYPAPGRTATVSLNFKF